MNRGMRKIFLLISALALQLAGLSIADEQQAQPVSATTEQQVPATIEKPAESVTPSTKLPEPVDWCGTKAPSTNGQTATEHDQLSEKRLGMRIIFLRDNHRNNDQTAEQYAEIIQLLTEIRDTSTVTRENTSIIRDLLVNQHKNKNRHRKSKKGVSIGWPTRI